MNALDEDVDLGASVDRAMLRHAERNERVLAWVRAVTMTPIFATNLAAWLGLLEGGRAMTWGVLLVTGGGALAAWLLVLHLARGGYRRSMQIAVPLVEGAFIAGAFVNWMRTLGEDAFRRTGSLTGVALICGIFAQSGALRLSRASIAVTTGIALVVFASFAVRLLPGDIGAISISVLAGMGGLAYLLTRIVRGAVRSEIARLTLRRFLPDHVIDRAHDDPVRLLTEPRSVDATVVITDIRGFTAWAESRPPAEVLARLNDLQGTLADHVRAHGGTVDKFMGDGMLAVFGAPEPMADHAQHALAAVRAIRQSTQRSSDLAIGIGVHSGELVMGCLGRGLRLEFTVIGDTVNTASRLEALTKSHGVDTLMSGAFKERLSSCPDLTSLGEVPIRGRKDALAVYSFDDGSS